MPETTRICGYAECNQPVVHHGNAKYHSPECKRAHYNERVQICPDCGNGIRRRDGDNCAACYANKRRSSWTEPCATEECSNIGRPEFCEKCFADIREYGEPQPYQIDVEWLENPARIPQSQHSVVRNQLLDQQGGKCALCGTTESTDWRLDHDHRCCPRMRRCWNCVRGVLCHTCNAALGMFDDDPDSLRRAAEYLESTRQLTLT